MGLLSKVLGKGISEPLKEVFNGIDSLTTSKEEKGELRKEALKLHIENQSNARDMYKADNILQKIFAVVFLVGYIIITFFMCWGAYKMTVQKVEFNNETVAILTMLFTAMSNKINTIVDFLFGGSQSVNDIAKK